MARRQLTFAWHKLDAVEEVEDPSCPAATLGDFRQALLFKVKPAMHCSPFQPPTHACTCQTTSPITCAACAATSSLITFVQRRASWHEGLIISYISCPATMADYINCMLSNKQIHTADGQLAPSNPARLRLRPWFRKRTNISIANYRSIGNTARIRTNMGGKDFLLLILFVQTLSCAAKQG